MRKGFFIIFSVGMIFVEPGLLGMFVSIGIYAGLSSGFYAAWDTPTSKKGVEKSKGLR